MTAPLSYLIKSQSHFTSSNIIGTDILPRSSLWYNIGSRMGVLFFTIGCRNILRFLMFCGYFHTHLMLKIAIYCDFILSVSKIVVLLHRKSHYIGIMDLKEIGQEIKARRATLGVNQRTVSELSGVAINTLVAIERGEGNPQITTLMDILDTIGLQLDVKPKVMEYETM